MLAFLAHPSHVLMYVTGDSLRRRLDATRNPSGICQGWFLSNQSPLSIRVNPSTGRWYTYIHALP
nr:hypothetical protein [Salmonella bongori serovar 66:z65:-]